MRCAYNDIKRTVEIVHLFFKDPVEIPADVRSIESLTWRENFKTKVVEAAEKSIEFIWRTNSKKIKNNENIKRITIRTSRASKRSNLFYFA